MVNFGNLSHKVMPNISGSIFTNGSKLSFVSEATITLVGSGISQITRANTSGEYIFDRVVAGQYTLTVYYHPTNLARERAITLADADLREDFDFVGILSETPRNLYVNLKYFQYYFLAAMGLLLSVGIVWGLYSFESDDIANVAFARGVITYLISAGTVGLAIILMFASVMTGGEDLEKRFDLGKQVFISLIGVMGTVIGFYFGSAAIIQPQDRSEVDSLVMATIRFKPLPVKKDSILTVSFSVSDGATPYNFEVVDRDGFLANSGQVKSQSADATVQLKVLKDIGATSSASLLIRGSDKKNRPFGGTFKIEKEDSSSKK